DDGSRRMSLGTLNKNALIIGYPLLDDLLGEAEIAGVKPLVSVEIRERADQRRSGRLGYSPQILLLASSHRHGTLLDEQLHAQIVDALGGEHDVRPGLEDQIYALQ